jgi:hypothetical protein
MLAAKVLFLVDSTSGGHYQEDENEMTPHVAEREI